MVNNKEQKSSLRLDRVLRLTFPSAKVLLFFDMAKFKKMVQKFASF